MPTQEERLTALEQATKGYRPVLQNVAYELTMVKGLIVEQTVITQDLREDMNEVKNRLTQVEDRLNKIETTQKEHTTILMQILEQLSKK